MERLTTASWRGARSLAKEKGAVREASYSVMVPWEIYGNRTHLIAVHFFNEAGTEVGLWSPATSNYQEFETPREWHPSFKESLSDWRDI